MEKVTLAVVVRLQKLTGVMADLQVDGATIKSVAPLVIKGITMALVVFEMAPKGTNDPYDMLTWLEIEYGDKVEIY